MTCIFDQKVENRIGLEYDRSQLRSTCNLIMKNAIHQNFETEESVWNIINE